MNESKNKISFAESTSTPATQKTNAKSHWHDPTWWARWLRDFAFYILLFILANKALNYGTNEYDQALIYGAIVILMAITCIRRMRRDMHGVISTVEKPWVYVSSGLYVRIPLLETVDIFIRGPIVDEGEIKHVPSGSGEESVPIFDPEKPAEIVRKKMPVEGLEIAVQHAITLSYPTGKRLVKALPFIPKNPRTFIASVITATISPAVFDYAATQTWRYLRSHKVEFSRAVEESVLGTVSSGSVIQKFRIGKGELVIEIRNVNLPLEAEQALATLEHATLNAIAAMANRANDFAIADNLIQVLGGDDKDLGRARATLIMFARELKAGGIIIDPGRMLEMETLQETKASPIRP